MVDPPISLILFSLIDRILSFAFHS
ncbi:hypothetical protein CCACVL1_00061, partial [Corchorus capsularis]